MDEIENIAITSEDADDPIQVSVVHYSWNPNIHWIVLLNPDWTMI